MSAHLSARQESVVGENTTAFRPYLSDKSSSKSSTRNVITSPGKLLDAIDIQSDATAHFNFGDINIINNIQTKLAVSEPGDAYEREADRVAEHVMRMPVSDSAVPTTTVKEEGIDRKCSDCGMEEEENDGLNIMRKLSSASNPRATHSIKNDINSIHSVGSPLNNSTREFMESRFGHDFSRVRIHTNTRAVESARALNALAYTVGNDIVIGENQYDFGTAAGKRLLAHELTHVVQQSSAGPLLQRQERSSVRFPTLEIAALRGQGAFSTGEAPLLPDEISDAQSVFGSSIDLSMVRIVYSPVISAPTTLGNSIRVPPSYSMPRRVLIHELTHVWQYQTKGTGYISDSVFHQSAATVISLLTTGRPDRGGAYRYTIQLGKSFHNYTAEQQAAIVEDFFAYPSLQNDPEYQRLISQVRASRPIIAPTSFFEEMAAGLPPRGRELPSASGRPGEPPFIPQIEWRF